MNKNKYDDGVEVGYKKKINQRVSFSDPKFLKNSIKEEINKLYPNTKYTIEEDNDGTIYINIDPSTEDFDSVFDGIDDLIESNYNDIEDYIIIVRESYDPIDDS